MEKEKAEIFRRIIRILEQEGYITKEESIGIMEVMRRRCNTEAVGGIGEIAHNIV